MACGRARRVSQSGPLARPNSVGVARYWLRAALPRRWRAWLVLGLLVGLVSGGVLMALASARRADTAYERFLDDTNSWDVAGTIQCDNSIPATSQPGDFVGEQGELVSGERRTGPPSPSACLDRFRALPSVADLTLVNQYGAQFTAVNGHEVQPTSDPCYSGPGLVNLAGDPSGRFGTEMNRFKIVAGRAADPTALHEVVVSQATAQRLGLRPGDALDTSLVSYERCQDGPATWPDPTRFTVVGIGVGSYEVPPSSGLFINFVTTTPAFVDAAGTDALDAIISLVRLRSGHDVAAVDAFQEEVEGAGMRLDAQLVQAEYHVNLQRSISPSVQALQLIAALGTLAGVAVLGQLLMRQTALETVDLHVLRSLGSSRRERFIVAASWAVPVAIVAMVTAFVVAIVGSSWEPIGVARILEPDPGWSFDPLVLGLGAAIVGPAVLLIAAIPAYRLAGPAAHAARVDGRTRPSRVVAGLTEASFPPTAVIGARMALETGRGRSAVPVRSSVLAIVVGLLALTATITFGSSLDRLLNTPRLVGWNWDNRIGYPAGFGSTGEDYLPYSRTTVIDALAAHPDVTAFGLGTIYPPFPGRSLELGDGRIPVASVSFDSGSGAIGPSITEGRAPSTPYEIVLGPVTAEVLGVGIGDRIVAHGQTGEWQQPDTYEDTRVEMEVVGLGILPLTGGDRLGTGAVTTTDGLRLLGGSNVELDSVFLRFTPGADPATVVRELAEDLGMPEVDDATLQDELTEHQLIPVLEVRSVDRMPLLLGVLMSLMSLAVLAHVLVSAVSARRGELALLRAIGFDGRQVRRTVAWQATTIALVALVIAVPLGIVVGRGVWLVFADRLGVVPEAAVPFSLVLLIPAVIAAAHLIAVVPARMAARGRPAMMLRSE